MTRVSRTRTLLAVLAAASLTGTARAFPTHARPLRRRAPLRASDAAVRDGPRAFARSVDPHTDALDADAVAAVDALVEERVRARERKDFRRADVLLNQLLSRHGVILNDIERTWRRGTRKEVKKRNKIAAEKGALVRYGPKAVDGAFALAADAGPNASTLTEAEIVARLEERREAQRARDYAAADGIRDALKAAGVYVEDGLKEWRWDGVPFATKRGKQRASSAPAGASWALARSARSRPLGAEAAAAVADLLARRSRARSGGDYATSDALRDRLFEAHDVRVDDKLGEWSAGGRFGGGDASHWSNVATPPSLAYARSAASRPLSAEDERRVQEGVDERMRAKRTRNYARADVIRDELYRDLDVTIHDKMNLWSAGGDFGEGHAWNHVVPGDRERAPTGEGAASGIAAPAAEREGDDAREDAKGDDAREDAAPSAPSARARLERLTVVRLKERLRAAGLTVSGKKATLVTRLLENVGA